MRKFDNGRQVHEPSHALDCVECAEDRVDQLDLLEVVLEPQQGLFRSGDVFAGLAQEVAQVLLRVEVGWQVNRSVIIDIFPGLGG